jgi:hypothetical protein
MKTKRERAGRPIVEREPVLVRLPAHVVSGLNRLAGLSDRSRSQLMERWLASLVRAVDLAGVGVEAADPRTVVDEIGRMLVGELVDMGVLGKLVADGLAVLREDQQGDVRRAKRG